VQIFGSLGVVSGHPVEKLHRGSARCAFTRLRPRCRSSSSRARRWS